MGIGGSFAPKRENRGLCQRVEFPNKIVRNDKELGKIGEERGNEHIDGDNALVGGERVEGRAVVGKAESGFSHSWGKDVFSSYFASHKDS